MIVRRSTPRAEHAKQHGDDDDYSKQLTHQFWSLSQSGTTEGVSSCRGRATALIEAHPHMLRHACGFALANKGHDTRALQAYLGHKNIQHTVRYTELSPTRFKNFWK